MSTVDAIVTGSSLQPPRAGSPDESELVAALRRGDREAAARLAERTYPQVFRAVARLCAGDGDLAADLTQETYRRAWASLGQFTGRARFSTWLYRIAYNTFLNHRRGPRRVQPLDEERWASQRDPAPAPEDRLGRRDREVALRLLVAELPDDQRFAVTALYWAELPVREIAALEGVTTVAIRRRLGRAFRRLAAGLEEDPR